MEMRESQIQNQARISTKISWCSVVGKPLCAVLVWVWLYACSFIHLCGSLCVEGLCMTWLMVVSRAPVYVLYLLVRLCPALVVLRVVFTYVYFEHFRWCNVHYNRLFVCPLYHWGVRCVTVHCTDCVVIPDFRWTSSCVCLPCQLCSVSLVLNICCVLYVGSIHSVLQRGLLRRCFIDLIPT